MNKAVISNIHKNIMGTMSFDMACKGHRGTQDFIVYPISKDNNAEIVIIQSDKRFGRWNPATGEIELNKSNPSRNNGAGFAFDKALRQTTIVQLSNVDNQALKMAVFTTTSKEAGKDENGSVSSDNSGAVSIFDL